MGDDGLLWRRGGKTFYVDTVVRGRRLRQSLRTRDRKVALTRAHQLVADLERRGPIALQMNRATVAQALALAASDARINGRKSTWKTGKNVERLSVALGDLKLAALTGAHLMVYVDQRKAAGFANASINRELATLRRGLILAADAGLVSRDAIPRIRLLKEAAPRSNFVEDGQYAALLQHLPAYLQPLIVAAYTTGWRVRSELLALEWHRVDLAARTLRLEPGTTKSGEGRVFVMTPALHDALTVQRRHTDDVQQRTGRIIPLVFHRQGRPIKAFRRAWMSACRRAGIPDRIPHDFRRTAVRNLERAGVSRSVAMKMVGHKTESIYRRYAIVNETDLAEAAQKLAALEQGARNGIHDAAPGLVNRPGQNQHAFTFDAAGGPRRRSTDGKARQ